MSLRDEGLGLQNDLTGLADILDRAVASAAGVIPAERLAGAAETARRLRRRTNLVDQTLFAVFAGGTGSGKSSLVNAICGAEIAPAGTIRPTTSRPLAVIPSNPEPGLEVLLDRLGIGRRVAASPFPWLALIDLPDTDSVHADHRMIVDRLLPEADLIVWVLDPEKYRDRLLHDSYLRPLRAHQDRFRFVLNQIDRLRETDLDKVRADLADALISDGIARPILYPMAVDPPVGPPIGLDPFLTDLQILASGVGITYDNLVIDLREASRGLIVELPPFGRWWDAVCRQAAGLLAEGDRNAAKRLLWAFVDDVGSATGVTLESFDLDLILASAPGQDPVRSLDATLGRTLRDALRGQGRAVANAFELSMALERLSASAAIGEGTLARGEGHHNPEGVRSH
jgi:energy-coupling factor transporter ATP-binding protein EcfA2